MGDSQGHVQAESPRNTKPRRWRGRGFCKPSQLQLQGGRQRHRHCRMQEKSTRSPRRSATVRQRGSFAASFRPATSSEKTTRDWRARIVEGLVREQPSPAALGRSCRSAPRYRKTVLVARHFDDGTIPPRREALARVRSRPLESQRRDRRLGRSRHGPSPCRGQARPHQAARRADRPVSFRGCATGRPGSAPEPR